MKLLKTFSVMAIAGLVLAGCASVAHVEKDDTVNFSSYKTFAWVDSKEEHKKGADLVENNVRNAVNKELEKEGWKEVKSKPDILLSYDLLVEKGIKENTNPVYSQPFTRVFFNPYTRRYGTIYYPSQFMGYDRDQYEVRQGTITISMIDAKTDKTVWQGWTTDEVNSRNLTSKEIQSSVKSIFRKFDVAKN
jgi:hypothetical protein